MATNNDDALSSSDHSRPCVDSAGSTSQENVTKSNNDSLNKRLGKVEEETKVLKKLRTFFLVTIFIIALTSSFFVYYCTAANEAVRFETKFKSSANEILLAVQAETLKKIQALDSLSELYTLYAHNLNMTWPYVTISDSTRFFETCLSATDDAWLAVLPIIPSDQRRQWELYSMNNQNWIDEGLEIRQRQQNIDNQAQEDDHDHDHEEIRFLAIVEGEEDDHMEEEDHHTEDEEEDDHHSDSNSSFSQYNDTTIPYIHNHTGYDESSGPWVVTWQYSPIIEDRHLVNFNHLASPNFAMQYEHLEHGGFLMSVAESHRPDDADIYSEIEHSSLQEMLEAREEHSHEAAEPLGFLRYPIFRYSREEAGISTSEHETTNDVVAIISATIFFKSLFLDLSHDDTIKGIVCVIQNSENQSFTYQIDGSDATYIGIGDLHEQKYNNFAQSMDYASLIKTNEDKHNMALPMDEDSVVYTFTLYPSTSTANEDFTNNPIFFAFSVLAIFMLTALMFIIYNSYVERRQGRVMTTAIQTTAIVSSLFPSNVRDRLLADVEATENNEAVSHPGAKKWKAFAGDSNRHSFMASSIPATKQFKSTAIADFFPDVTIMFSDICGFTSWCSQRQPVEVFTLLETLFQHFDDSAKHFRVFKVETVGDCYVAVCGLPEKRKNHAVAMARFAKESLQGLGVVLAELEIQLGPDVSTLQMRFGLHSGSVTAGVVRGENARYQIFGDSVNTASRMESTSMKGRIQISKDTADRLIAAGKSRWIEQREDTVFAKGKGEMQTFWLKPNEESNESETVRSSAVGDVAYQQNLTREQPQERNEREQKQESELSDGVLVELNVEQTERLVKWAIKVLHNQLEKIASRRKYFGSNNNGVLNAEKRYSGEGGKVKVLEEIQELIAFPTSNQNSTSELNETSHGNMVSTNAITQLERYVRMIASMYNNDNYFHTFDHAAHVILSVTKLLSRIVATDKCSNFSTDSKEEHSGAIASDPLTQFACIFSALIHDCDHTGVSNGQLIQERARVATRYNNRSVAEQNSIDIAWNLLMEDEYKDLRAAIYSTEAELVQFRQILVNTVLATDIFDHDLKAFRNARWEKTFSPQHVVGCNQKARNRKATIVIEHLIQASDVAHTMQHWQVYLKWNECLFMEFSQAFSCGRGKVDPAINWYEGELKFYDNYIIPLAKKLKDCKVFGVSSDEYLMYAEMNRREWEEKGKQIVAEMVERRKDFISIRGQSRRSL